MSSSTNWVGLFLMFALPLALGFGAFRVASRFRKQWARFLARFFGGAMLTILLIFIAVGAPYFWALHLESKWEAANPKNRAELEACLSLYSRHNISPSESPWGKRRQLKPDEHMVQYWLLYSPSAPLDVVYTTNETIVAIYTSYE